MRSRTDWSAVWPVAGAAAAFGIVYAVSLAGGAAVEDVLVRSTGALLVAGLAGTVLQAVVGAAVIDDEPEPPPPPGSTIDITLDE